VIENDREPGPFSEMLESLDRLGRELTPEEKALDVLLVRLIADYDEKIDLPELPAHETIAFPERPEAGGSAAASLTSADEGYRVPHDCIRRGELDPKILPELQQAI
jgi:hypothetical protein